MSKISGYSCEDGEQIEVEGIRLVYREEKGGFYYELDHGQELRVLSDRGGPTYQVEALAGKTDKLGLKRYLETLESLDKIENIETDKTGFSITEESLENEINKVLDSILGDE